VNYAEFLEWGAKDLGDEIAMLKRQLDEAKKTLRWIIDAEPDPEEDVRPLDDLLDRIKAEAKARLELLEHPGVCPTGKRIYWEERLANRAVSKAATRGELPPMRHYLCPYCCRWHLSSQHRPGQRPIQPLGKDL
jgi:hypothetical protein